MKKIYFLLLALGLFASVNAQIINIPDANFKEKLLLASSSYQVTKDFNDLWFKVDVNNNGEIEVAEALLVKELRAGGTSGMPGYVASLVGVEYFTNLRVLTCTYSPELTAVNFNGLINLEEFRCNNTKITSLDVTPSINMKTLSCGGNSLLTSLNVNGLINLTSLECSYNRLSSLDVSNLISLTHLHCNSNQITSLNLTNLPNLGVLSCPGNQLSSLNINGLEKVEILYCQNNLLTSLDFSNFGSAIGVYLNCSNNRFTTLDLSKIKNIDSFNCSDNPFLQSFILKNGNYEEDAIYFSNNPNLHYICQDDDPYQLWKTQILIDQHGYTNTCTLNSYCSFVPGGTFYTIQGTSKFDVDNNGCTNLDFSFPYLKFNLSSGANSGDFIVNRSGDYSIPVGAGTHTITPNFENPSYFNVSPATVNVTFPAQASPFTNNFCVAANGIHPDLEIVLLPVNLARPGIDIVYKVIYKNKGNTVQSGSVSLTFNDAVLDFIFASPAAASQVMNSLSWNFTNLLPFESREIYIVLNANSPMETPAVNAGDVLNHTATITSAAIDDMPSDNTFVFNNLVVNSLDPNDKTCLEGTTIAPSEVGKYVHYMIRFENTGTANAQNIVVRDLIDTDKFDVNSLIPINGSHSFTTKIAETNRVEFIFQNINLPFDDANNDGYIAFKIKTKPTLVVGNTFSNTASIYFDYNFPIVTNTATTTIAALSRQDFEFSSYFNLYPNPVHDVLNISAKETIEISSINIYNTLGQLVLVIPNATAIKTVDVSNLTSGNYFIKINSDKGTANTKFIKN